MFVGIIGLVFFDMLYVAELIGLGMIGCDALEGSYFQALRKGVEVTPSGNTISWGSHLM